MNEYKVTILGAGLAGCEAALWLAGKGVQVELYEQKPVHFSPAHKSEGFAELTPYIENGTLNVDGMDLSAGYVINQDTGKKILYGIPASQLPGLQEYGLICDDFCLGVSVAGENEEEAIQLLQWLIDNLRGGSAE